MQQIPRTHFLKNSGREALGGESFSAQETELSGRCETFEGSGGLIVVLDGMEEVSSFRKEDSKEEENCLTPASSQFSEAIGHSIFR